MTSDTANTTRALRKRNDLVAFWRVCGNAACRRAQSCRGRARTCDQRNAALVPEGVLTFFEALRVAKRDGTDFEDFKADMEAAELDEIYFAWRNEGVNLASAR